jgi:hypothetical protein
MMGALGLLAGFFVPTFTRLRVGDSALETLPAVILLGVNVFIFLYAIGLGGST